MRVPHERASNRRVSHGRVSHGRVSYERGPHGFSVFPSTASETALAVAQVSVLARRKWATPTHPESRIAGPRYVFETYASHRF